MALPSIARAPQIFLFDPGTFPKPPEDSSDVRSLHVKYYKQHMTFHFLSEVFQASPRKASTGPRKASPRKAQDKPREARRHNTSPKKAAAKKAETKKEKKRGQKPTTKEKIGEPII